MNDLLAKNLGWKLFSIIAAIILWFMVINIENPMDSKSFSNIPVKIINEDTIAGRQLIMTNREELENARVTITVRATRRALEELTANRGLITATVDLRHFTNIGVTQPSQIAINVSLPNTKDPLEMTQQYPRMLTVVLEKNLTVQQNIRIEPRGDVAQGYMLYGLKSDPNIIQLSGAESDIERIYAVKVSVDVSGASASFTVNKEPKIYDKEGNEILGLGKDIKSVQVEIPIMKKKLLSLKLPPITGLPAEGFTLFNVGVEPKLIEVAGDPEVIDRLTQIDLLPISLNNLTDNQIFTQDVAALLPRGIMIIDTIKQAKITAEIKKMGYKEFAIPINQLQINIPEGVQAVFVSSVVPITLRGIEEVINNITQEMIEASVNLTGYGAGRHEEVPVYLRLPEGITRVGDPPTLIVEIKKEQGEEVVETSGTDTVPITPSPVPDANP